MSYIVKNKDLKLLVSFSSVQENEYILLATNFKRFFVQKHISSDIIQDKFNESDTRIKIPLVKIIKIIKDDEPTDAEISINGNMLKLKLKYPIKINKMRDTFTVDFELLECTLPAEIGEFFMKGLLKTVIEEKLQKSEKPNISLPNVSFVANFVTNDVNIADLCSMIGGSIESEEVTSNQKTLVEQSEPKEKVSKRTFKRPNQVNHQEFKFEKLNDSQDSQEIEALNVTQRAESTNNKVAKNSKKNIKF